jgi:hypothetical protein
MRRERKWHPNRKWWKSGVEMTYFINAIRSCLGLDELPNTHTTYRRRKVASA